MKSCSECKRELPITAFGKKATAADGRASRCLICQREYAKRWRVQHPEKAAEQAARWRRKNPKYTVEWNRTHPESRAITLARHIDKNIISIRPDDASLKRCSSCLEMLPLSKFWTDSSKKDGRASKCARCASFIRASKNFGVSVEAIHAMWDDQEGRCAVCSTVLPMRGKHSYAIDHDHDTGAMRSILCAPCNVGIGHFHDSPEICEAAAKYLRLHAKERAAA